MFKTNCWIHDWQHVERYFARNKRNKIGLNYADTYVCLKCGKVWDDIPKLKAYDEDCDKKRSERIRIYNERRDKALQILGRAEVSD
jgi:hypothetical protein